MIDTDLYDGLNPQRLAGTSIGTAEYTNGNFLSRDRRFESFALPRRAGLGNPFLEPEGAKPRRYFPKVTDGEAVAHFVAESTLYEPVNAELGRPMDEALILTRRVHQDYAAKLLPRAVGYSAALLDYFFRGRLEVDFAANPNDPNGSLLMVTNGSSEPLGPGTLTVYKDDAQGNRQPVLGATLTLTTPVDTNGLLPGIPLAAADQVGALAVVFVGALGQEAGAVAGRALSPVAIEQVFRGASDWMLRTAEGIFPLGIGLGPNRVKWGDRDNTLVAAQGALFGADSVFAAYRINRPEGSAKVPLLPDGRVDLVPLGSATLGGAPIDLGTTVTYTRSTEVVQQMMTFEAQILSLTETQYTSATLQTFDLGIFPFTATFPLVLQLPDPIDNLYDWFLHDFSLNGDGDVVATVRLLLRNSQQLSIECWGRSIGTGATGELGKGAQCWSVDFDFIPPRDLVFMVNLTRRSVVAKSSADLVDITLGERDEPFTPYTHFISHIPQAGDAWIPDAGTGLRGTGPSIGGIQRFDGVMESVRSRFYRPELASAGFAESGLNDFTTVDDVELNASATFRVTHVKRLWCGPTGIYDIGQSSGVVGRYTLVGWKFCPDLDTGTNTWVPLQWNPGAGTVTRLAGLSASPQHSFNVTLAGASRSAGLFIVDEEDPVTFDFLQSTHLVTPQRELIFPGDLSGQYRLLGPNVLLSTSDARLHHLNATLDPLPVPPVLAPGGPAAGEYHFVGQR